MKKILFLVGFMLSTNAFAATGAGEAQAELTTPLSISIDREVSFGTIAIDPSAGPQTIEVYVSQITSCPPSYVCSGSVNQSIATVSGAPHQLVSASVEGSTAILDDGSGNQLIFDPFLGSGKTESFNYDLGASGSFIWSIGGTIDFTGNETAGIYRSTNTGGSGYQVTVNY
ncbi:MAG: DUF4402 domain-containing protein [Alphaproteobacteria bacterium]|nr:DUF4402 domain-containing protein [Alphaproteobacteria bacterium]MBN2779557.1 DUF4402 domain-containing protein [Alphaproteobacteria bacterium]